MSEEKESSASASPTPPAKYSRYRRQAAKPGPVPEPEPAPVSQSDSKENADFTRSKSMSRYRRSRAVSKPDPVATPSMPPPVPTIPKPHAQIPPAAGFNASGPMRRVTEPAKPIQREQRPLGTGGKPEQGRPRETENERLQRKVREYQEREKQQLLKTQQEKAEKERMTQQQKAEAEVKAKVERARLAEEENAKLLEEQKRKDLERLQAELDAASPAPVPLASPAKEKLGFFSRKRAATKASPPRSSESSSGPSLSQTKSNEPPRKIEQGRGSIVPQTDAPISASNAGERRVLIRCKQSSINLPINPETTPVDIIYSSANIMTQNIVPSAAILMESYTQLGLERRIRRYEHIRDIMNSWDRDTQNALHLMNSDSPNYDTDLEASSVPKEAPADFTAYMYHSQKPGKWNKRFITLLSSGQIFMSKKAGAKMSDRDIITLCHLSDFDIYTPTAAQTRKTLKPPKKICYAVKSQQKTTMFLSTENFVHFFSTDDDALAQKWYDAVQGWRSWYLVNRMGEGEKKRGKTVTELSTTRPGTRGGHTVKVSVDESPYTIGSFTPLLNLGRFGLGEEEGEDEEDENRPRQVPFHLRNSVSLNPMPSKRESKRHPPPVSYRLPPEAEEEFASGGLLGRTYSQRQRLQKEREAALNSSQPFVDGPSLLNLSGAGLGGTHQRTASMKERPDTAGAALGRSGSQRRDGGMPKPLLDFTPQFREAPQWDKSGKGHGVGGFEGVPLVEAATTPDNPLGEIPRATVFRREGAGGGGGARPVTSGGGGSIMNRGRVVYD